MPSNLHYLTVNDNKQRVREKLGLKGEEKDAVWRTFEVRDCFAFLSRYLAAKTNTKNLYCYIILVRSRRSRAGGQI